MPDALPQVKLHGSISGSTCEGALTLVSWSKTLTNQDAHIQLTATVGISDVNKLVALPVGQGPTGSGQTFFAAKSDQDVRIRLNGLSALEFNISGGVPLMFPGSPEISQVELTGIAATDAKVFVTKIMDTTWLTNPPNTPVTGSIGFFTNFENLGTAGAGQTAFTLGNTPADTSRIIFMVDGVGYTVASGAITVVGTAITWTDTEFVLAGTERIEVLY